MVQPAKKQTLDNGGTHWVYHKRHCSSVGARNVCLVFELRFDAQTALKDWEDHEVNCNAEAM
ncbi:hypothetical protein W02_09430 [Nitrospira sp. KM1]|nr:hypothetical protein W02_09430 [Nitrospira sp. KM1]